MNSKIIVTGIVSNVVTRQYVSQKDNQTKEMITVSLPYRKETTKDANGQDVTTYKWCNFSQPKNAFNEKLAKGDCITVVGEPNLEVFNKQDGTQGYNLKIMNPELSIHVAGSRILPYGQTTAPQTNNGQTAPQASGKTPTLPGANPYQGYNSQPGQYGGAVPPQGGQPYGNGANPYSGVQSFNVDVSDDDLPF